MGRVPGTRGDAPSRNPPPSRIGKGHGSHTVAELLVGGGIHQTVELALVGQRHAEEPAFAFGVAVDQRRVFLALAIALGHDALDRGIYVTCGLYRIDNFRIAALRTVTPALGPPDATNVR